jgi:hypothetical protein
MARSLMLYQSRQAGRVPRQVPRHSSGLLANAPDATGGRNCFKEGKGIPDPIMMVRHAGHGGWEDTSNAVLGLTKLNWNDDALYDRLPVALGFASTSHIPSCTS